MIFQQTNSESSWIKSCTSQILDWTICRL